MQSARHILAAIIVGAVLGPAGDSPGADPALAAAAAGVREIVGHRGSCADRPENTLASYRRAIEAGATACEIDVRTTRDGVLVSLHDADLSRTTDGAGKVGEKTLEEIRRLDAGAKFDVKFAGQRIPSVREILELCKGRCDVLFDLKETGAEYAERVAAEIRRFGEPKRAILGVRSVEQARQFRKLLPEARQIGLIPKQDDIEAFAAAGTETIRLWPRWLSDATLVPRVRKAGVKLHLGAGKGTAEEVTPLLAHRPESMSSDDPARLIGTLKEISAGK